MKKLLVFAMVMGMVPSLMGMENQHEIVQFTFKHFGTITDGKLGIAQNFLQELQDSLARFKNIDQLKKAAFIYIQNALVNTANYFSEQGRQLGLEKGLEQAKAQATFSNAFSNYSVSSKGGIGLAAVVFTGFALTGVYTAGLAFNQWRKNRKKN